MPSKERRGKYKKKPPYKGKKPGPKDSTKFKRGKTGKWEKVVATAPDKKVCYECYLEQGIKEFYKYKKMADGHLNICKTCLKSRVNQGRKQSKELNERWLDEGGWEQEYKPEPKEKWIPLSQLTSKNWRN